MLCPFQVGNEMLCGMISLQHIVRMCSLPFPISIVYFAFNFSRDGISFYLELQIDILVPHSQKRCRAGMLIGSCK